MMGDSSQASRSWISTVGSTVGRGVKTVGAWLFGRSNNGNITTLKYSKNLGLSAKESEEESKEKKIRKITLRATEMLLGDILGLSDEKIERLQGKLLPTYVSLTVDRYKKVVDIEIDVEKIKDNVKEKYPVNGMSPEQIEKIIIGEIVKAVDNSIKVVAQTTGGELKRYTDLKLVYGIAKKLYKEHQSKKEDQDKVGNDKNSDQSNGNIINSEKIKFIDSSMINPKETISINSNVTNSIDSNMINPKETISINSNVTNPIDSNITNPKKFPFLKLEVQLDRSAESITKQPVQTESHGSGINEEIIKENAEGLANVLSAPNNTTCSSLQPRSVQQETNRGGGRGK